MSRTRYVIYVNDEHPALIQWLESMPKGSRSDQICALLSWAISSPLSGQNMPAPASIERPVVTKRKRPELASKVTASEQAPQPIPVPHQEARHASTQTVAPAAPVASAPADDAEAIDVLDMMWNIGG